MKLLNFYVNDNWELDLKILKKVNFSLIFLSSKYYINELIIKKSERKYRLTLIIYIYVYQAIDGSNSKRIVKST